MKSAHILQWVDVFSWLTHRGCGCRTCCWAFPARSPPRWRVGRSQQPAAVGVDRPPSWKTTQRICLNLHVTKPGQMQNGPGGWFIQLGGLRNTNMKDEYERTSLTSLISNLSVNRFIKKPLESHYHLTGKEINCWKAIVKMTVKNVNNWMKVWQSINYAFNLLPDLAATAPLEPELLSSGASSLHEMHQLSSESHLLSWICCSNTSSLTYPSEMKRSPRTHRVKVR